MKALFLCAGKGTRMRPISYSLPKHLIPVGNKPVLQWNVEMVAKAGIKDIGMVVSPSTKDHYESHLGTEKWGASFEYIEQENPMGLAHAVQCGKSFVGEEPFLVYLGDNLLKLNLSGMINNYRESGTDASILLKSVRHPERFGVAEIEGGNVVGLVEKPKDPPSDLAIVGVYLFDSKIFDAIEVIEPSDRGELEITDAVAQLIEWDHSVNFASFDGWWVDVGRPEDAIEANRLVIEDVEASSNVAGTEGVAMENPESVNISERAELKDCEVIGPTIIGEGTSLMGCRIGPNVSVGNSCELRNTKLSNSVLMDGVEVSGGELKNSLIGKEVKMELPEGAFKIYSGNQGVIKES